MADDKQPVQADGTGMPPDKEEGDPKGEPASPLTDLSRTGQSGGGAYPNPHTGKHASADGPDTFMGHGGQTDIAYHGKGQLGEKEEGGTSNAVTKED